MVCNITCKNISENTVSDVLQLYVHVNGTAYEVPNKKLAAFQRITLAKGESNSFQITIPASAFSVVDDAGNRIYDGKGATISVGFSSDTDCEISF